MISAVTPLKDIVHAVLKTMTIKSIPTERYSRGRTESLQVNKLKTCNPQLIYLRFDLQVWVQTALPWTMRTSI